VTTNAIIVNGDPVYVGRPVRLWNETGLAFRDRPKRTETRAVWLHLTGGERGGDGVFETLHDRGVSVNFCIDQDGTIWQYCDASVATAHAGGSDVVLSANPWAVGIEICNRANAEPSHKRWPREVASDVIRGEPFKATRFYPAQIQSAVALCNALCRAYGLPMDVPREVDGSIAARTLTIDELRSFRGVGGHFHNHLGKRDPGTEVLKSVADAGKVEA